MHVSIPKRKLRTIKFHFLLEVFALFYLNFVAKFYALSQFEICVSAKLRSFERNYALSQIFKLRYRTGFTFL